MSPGYQICQSLHAISEFIFKFPFLAYRWHKRSNYIAALSVADEVALIELISILKQNKIRHSVFREPDINHEITAICIEPTDKAKRICTGLPLALKEFSNSGINKNNYKPIPPKKNNRIVVHTLAYNLSSEVRDAVELLYKQNNSEDFTHVIVDLGFPLLNKNEIPSNIDNAKLMNSKENILTATQYGSKFLAINNEGVSQNWEMVRKQFKITDNDILICADPDERPKNNGWVNAVADVISNAEIKIGWCSLMMKEHVPLMKKENEKIIDGHKVYIIPNGGFNWAQGGFNGRFLNQIGGVPVPAGAPIYGWIEHACTEKMNKLGYKTAILADYFVEHTECSPLYRAWKTDVTSNVKNGQIDFETWLRKKKK